MEGVSSDGMCRCCAAEGNFKDFQVPYQWMGVEEIYGNMLKDCFDITLSVSEEMNNGGICEVCITQLRNACNFKQQVQRTEEKFQKKLQEGTFKTDVIKMEVSRFEDDDSNMSGDDFSSQEYEVPIKVEKVEEKPKKRAAAKASTSKAKKSKTSDGEPSVKRVRHQLTIKKEMTDDGEKSHIKDEGEKIKSNKHRVKTPKKLFVKGFSEKTKRTRPLPEIVTAIAKMPNVTIVKGLSKSFIRPSPILNKTAVIKLPNNTVVKGLPKKKEDFPLSDKHKHHTNLEVILAYSNATPIRSHDGFTYTCCFCTGQYTNPADLKTHTLEKHNNTEERREFMKKQTPHAYLLKLDITLLKCKICDQSIDSLEGLFDHLQNEHKKNVCTDVKNQIFPLKFDGEEHKCVNCPLVFSKFKILLEHMHTHYRNFVCEECDYGCTNMRRMYNHKQLHKTGSFKCGKCNKVFETHQRMRTHMNAVHKYKNMPNKCAVCNERFNSHKLKDQHLVTVHGMTPVIRKCSACDKTFTSQNLLRTHTKRFHLMERRFKCTECEMTFYAKNQLQFHMLKHTGRKDFQCDVCLKWFTRKYVLKEHMRIHMNDRRFTCLQCGRGFVQKCSWRSHMRTVHGEIDDKISTS